MAREIEKSLEKELERAVKDQDRAQEDADVAKSVYDESARRLIKVSNEVKGIAGAIIALRGNTASEAWINNLVKDARANMTKEKPVA
jgi:hypothetical protein